MSDTPRPLTPAPWNPAENAADRLLQVLDALAINLHRYRELEARVPRRDWPTAQAGWDSMGAEERAGWRAAGDAYSKAMKALTKDYHAVDLAIARQDGCRFVQQFVGDLVERAVVEFAQAGRLEAEPAIRDAAAVAAWVAGVLTPDASEPYPEREVPERYAREGELLALYRVARQALLSEYSRVCRLVPLAVRNRHMAAMVHAEDPDFLSHDQVMALVTEVHPGGATSQIFSARGAEGPAPPMPPKRGARSLEDKAKAGGEEGEKARRELNICDIIRGTTGPPKAVVVHLRSRKDVVELASEAGVTIDAKLVKKARRKPAK